MDMAVTGSMMPFVIGSRLFHAAMNPFSLKTLGESGKMVAEKVDALSEAVLAVNRQIGIEAVAAATSLVAGKPWTALDATGRVLVHASMPYTDRVKANHARFLLPFNSSGNSRGL